MYVASLHFVFTQLGSLAGIIFRIKVNVKFGHGISSGPDL